jgi:hypothetical protein
MINIYLLRQALTSEPGLILPTVVPKRRNARHSALLGTHCSSNESALKTNLEITKIGLLHYRTFDLHNVLPFSTETMTITSSSCINRQIPDIVLAKS